MRDVFEIAYRYVMPSLRRALTEELYKRKLSKKEIASKLLLSHSLVSRYINGERGYTIELRQFKDVNELVSRLADEVVSKDLSIYEINEKLIKIAIYVMSKKYLCNFHSRIDPDIDPIKCSICPNTFKSGIVEYV
ncbi:MAG: hypothetical protein QXH99_06475 [Sulfolobales archaeon]